MKADDEGATYGAPRRRFPRADQGPRGDTGPTHVAFLRAINVGGHVVKMDRLRALFEAIGHRDVETFIASGNVAFTATNDDPAALEADVERALGDALGWAVATFVRTPGELAAVAARRPFGEIAVGDKATEYVAFLKTVPEAAGRDRVLACRSEVDDFAVDGRELHWRVQGSALDSRLTGGKLQKLLGAPVTARNVTTVRRIVAKLASRR